MSFYWKWCLFILLPSPCIVTQSLCPRQSRNVLQKWGETFGPAITVLKCPRMNCLSHCLSGSKPGKDSSSSAPALSVFLQLLFCQREAREKLKAKMLALMPPRGQAWWKASESAARFVTSQQCGECNSVTPELISFLHNLWIVCLFPSSSLSPSPRLFFQSVWKVFIKYMAHWSLPVSAS